MGAAVTGSGDAPARTGAHRARYRRILRFAARQFVQVWWFELVLPRFGLAALAERHRDRRMRRVAQRFHALAVDLGGLMIKVGQFLSSRLDVLPPEITRELEGLQDEVPPVPFPAIRALAEAELGVPLERAYTWFDEVPVAAASLGQAHRARLSELDAADTGFAEVVVKVQRPGIEGIIAVDLAALRRVGGWLQRVRFVAERVDAPALVEEFAHTCLEEVDYLQEAANAGRFADDFAGDPRVNAPEVAWERTTRRVLTLSDVTAIKINDVDALRTAGIDPAEVADVFASVMFDQFFTHGFFHADPHPGNIFVTPLRPADGAATPDGAGTSAAATCDGVAAGRKASDSGGVAASSTRPWRLTFIDFGMMGEVPANLRDGLRSLVIAVAARDGRKLVEAAQEVGVLLPTANTTEFERAVTQLFARFGGMGFAELRDVDPREFRDFAVEFGDMIRSLPFQLPEGLLLLFRAVSLTSGMCSALDPAFNVWDAVEPYAARLLREETGNTARAMARDAWGTAGTTWRLPGRIDSLITRMNQGDVSFDTSRLEHRLGRLERLVRRGVSAVIFAALFIGGSMVLTPNAALGTTLMVGSVVPFLHAVFAGRLPGR